MLAYVVLLFAVLSRILPHAFHAVNWNFTAVGGGLLFFGSRMGATPGRSAWQTVAKLASAVAVLVSTDYYLIGMQILQKASLLRVVAGVLASATSFFLLSNFMVWVGGTMTTYPRTLAGLGACYMAAIPFYRNDVVSTAITAGALFGLPVLAARIVESLHTAQQDNLPLA